MMNVFIAVTFLVVNAPLLWSTSAPTAEDFVPAAAAVKDVGDIAENVSTARQEAGTFKEYMINHVGPMMGAAGTAVSLIMSTISFALPKQDSDELKAIKEVQAAFKKMHDRFDAVEKRLDGIDMQLATIISLSKYDGIHAKVAALKVHEKYFLSSLKDMDKESLINSCRDDTDPLTLLTLIEQFTSSGINVGYLHNAAVAYDENDAKLETLLDVITMDVAHSMRLKIVCDIVISPKDADYTNTVRKSELQETGNKIASALDKFYDDFKAKCEDIPFMNQTLGNILRDNKELDHASFASKMKTQFEARCRNYYFTATSSADDVHSPDYLLSGHQFVVQFYTYGRHSALMWTKNRQECVGKSNQEFLRALALLSPNRFRNSYASYVSRSSTVWLNTNTSIDITRICEEADSAQKAGEDLWPVLDERGSLAALWVTVPYGLNVVYGDLTVISDPYIKGEGKSLCNKWFVVAHYKDVCDF